MVIIKGFQVAISRTNQGKAPDVKLALLVQGWSLHVLLNYESSLRALRRDDGGDFIYLVLN